MGEFLASQQYVLKNEGGYTPIDGDTYRGIARRFFPKWEGWATVDAHKPLEQGQVIDDHNLDSLVNQFYKKQFWDTVMGDLITSQEVATYLYDFHVNAGANAIKEVQRLVNVDDDGIFGNRTLAAVNAQDEKTLLNQLMVARKNYYQRIAKGDNAKYLAGWLHRADGLYQVLSA